MNKYTKRAIVKLASMLVITSTITLILGFLTTVYGFSSVVIGAGLALGLFCSYKYVVLQAEIDEQFDKLNKK
jgi:hypothetical protein